MERSDLELKEELDRKKELLDRREEYLNTKEWLLNNEESAEKYLKVLIAIGKFVGGLFAILIGCFICYFASLL